MKKTYKDTDLREALRRKYSDTLQLPTDFMEKMQERMDQWHEQSESQPVAKTRKSWRWVAAAACLLILVGLGITMLPKEQVKQGKGKEIFAQTNNPQKKEEKTAPEEQQVRNETTNEKQEESQLPITSSKVNTPIVAETYMPSEISTSTETSPMKETSPSTETPATYLPARDNNLHYASQAHTDDSTYQAPHRMNEFIAKIAEHNKVKAMSLDCASDTEDSTIVNTAYVFQDTKELDLFGRLLQAACWYDSKTPGYQLNFSHQQFFFTLKDLRKGEKYLWIAERVEGQRILLFSTHSPIGANVSSVCYQKYREQLTHIHL